jgi:Putative Ig domain
MARNSWRLGILAVAASMALSACKPGNASNPSSNEATPGANNQDDPNAAPTIAGIPATSVAVGTTYVFQPNAGDVDGDALTFSATGLPSWVNFNPQTGLISGTPTAGNMGTSTAITITVTDGEAGASLPAFTIAVAGMNTPPATPPTTPPATNTAPVISGSPATTVRANATYSFTPTSSDANGDSLGFSITGKPVWATFSTATGRLTGTPSTVQVGAYSNIAIAVSDGKVSRSLAAFSITVTSPANTGTATLSWSAPTQNTDGSQLTNLAGYRIYHGTSASALTDIRTVASISSSYQFTALSTGTHYFAISAYNTDGAESSLSVVGSKTIQ